MRPTKHATHARRNAQEIFEISIARLASTKEKAVPVVAASEPGDISLFVWDAAQAKWQTTDIGHAPIEAPRDVPSITNTWNWSRRVGLATFDESIALVYKRAETVPPEETPKPALLMLDIYKLRDDGFPQRELHIPVPMPTYFVESPLINHIGAFVEETPGFELWTGVDARRRKLLIVTQTLGEFATDKGDNAQLALLIGDLDRLDDPNGWKSKKLDDGGYGLDVRNDGDRLIIVYRTTPEALNIPLPFGTIDPFFAGLPNFELDAQLASDQFYSPLRVMTLDLETLDTRKIDLPGGEHPRIQNIEPLFVVVDRPILRVRFRLVTIGDRREARIDWTLTGVDKLAFLFDEEERIARGVLLSFREGDSPTFPRTSTPWIDSQDLFTEITPTGFGAASTKSRFPIEPLKLDRDRKGFSFDFLQKAPLFALLESRARLDVNFPQGTLTTVDLQSAVYDINHGQFRPPDTLRPDTTGENAQFAPFEPLSQASANILVTPSYLPDNTIGGSVVTDRDGVPYQFFCYTDLGDGGLRVIFDLDLGPPDAPPPINKPKTLESERVPGPGSGDERWIELDPAADFQDAGVPGIRMTNLLEGLTTVTSAVHVQIESLLSAALSLTNLPSIEDGGWTDDQVNSIQTALNDFAVSSGAEPEIIFSDDETVFISILPDVVVADANNTWEAGVVNETVADVAWRFTLIVPPDVPPVIINRTGNSIPVALSVSGDWTVRATTTLDDGSVRTLETVVTAEESLFRRTASVHREIANRELGPPINSVGSVRIGTAIIKLLQYDLEFQVEPDALFTHHVTITRKDKTDAQWRFRANGTEQGLVDYRLRIKFESSDIRLGGLLNLLLKVESVKASFFYGRSFTPGILMNDTRSAVPLTGAESSVDGLTKGTGRLASAMTTRPFRNDGTTTGTVDVKVSMLAQAAAASVITLLVGLGAATAATVLVALVAALGVATAAASAPVVGVASAAAVVAATVAIFLFITFAVPPIVEGIIETGIGEGLTNEDTRQSLEDARLLQFAGEGVAEAISRQVIEKATGDPPSEDTAGQDRYRQDFFQMIHVSEGRARVLIRE